MTLVKISDIGDGNGALSISRGGPIPTYGQIIDSDGNSYEVVGVKRYTSKKRPDSVLVDVDESEEGISRVSNLSKPSYSYGSEGHRPEND